ncbi:hypothetical protein Tco_0059472 [Tanacetum coccineum]
MSSLLNQITRSLFPLEPFHPFQLLGSSCTVLFVSAEAQRDHPTFKLLSSQTSSSYTYNSKTEAYVRVLLVQFLCCIKSSGFIAMSKGDVGLLLDKWVTEVALFSPENPTDTGWTYLDQLIDPKICPLSDYCLSGNT